MSDARGGRQKRVGVVVVVFRLTMAVVITLYARRPYEEIAVARARASGALVQADATVEKRTEVWRGWHSGLGGNTLLALSPLFMGYLNVLAVTARVRRARRRGISVADPINFTFDMVLGFIAGAVAILVRALIPGLLGTDQPRYWPLIPAATTITATLLLMRQTLRSDPIEITPAPAGGTTAESKPRPALTRPVERHGTESLRPTGNEPCPLRALKGTTA
ncbi:hypothetical protein [Streptomyces sp. NPDC002324]